MNKVFDRKKTFSFLDESGVFEPCINKKTNNYGIGFIKHPDPFLLNQKLHTIYESLCNDLKKDETRVEFSFKSLTSKSLKSTLACLEELKNDKNWEFSCLYIDVEDRKYHRPESAVARWEAYITYVKMLIENNLWPTEETVLIADYLRKPNNSRKRFEYIAMDIPQVYNLLQVESHGVILLQLADILLGGFLYSLGDYSDKEGNKKKVSDEVLKLRELVGRNRFNTWKVKWKSR
jgi:hypothetical protein